MTDSMPDGPEKILETAKALGIPPASRPSSTPASRNRPRPRADAGITLGTATVSPINMANAYATIANGGERADVHVIEKVVDRNGETRYAYKAADQATRVDEDIAADTSYALQQVVQNGTGAGRAGARPAGGRQDRHRDQRQGPGLLGLVRRLHPAARRPR